MASSSSPIITPLLLNNKNTHKFRNFNGDGHCSLLLSRSNLHGFSSRRSSNKDLVVRRATPEVAGDLLSSFSIPGIPFGDNPWLIGICGLVVGFPLMIQKLVSLSKQLDTAAQTVENIADAVENIADGVDKAAEELKESLPEGRFKEVVTFVEKLAEDASDGADKISDVMDKVEEIDDKLEDFLDKNLKSKGSSNA